MGTSERERLLERLRGVKTLAEQGNPGERDNAAALLVKLMEKHGITDADLEGAEIQTYWIRYKTEYERKLLHQLAYKHTGSGHAYGCVGRWSNRPRKEVGIDCTPAQYIEIEADFEFYRAAMAEEMDLFYTAFINKNDLFPPPELAGDVEATGDIDLVRLEKLEAMMDGIEHRTRHKSIGDGSSEEDEDGQR